VRSYYASDFNTAQKLIDNDKYFPGAGSEIHIFVAHFN